MASELWKRVPKQRGVWVPRGWDVWRSLFIPGKHTSQWWGGVAPVSSSVKVQPPALSFISTQAFGHGLPALSIPTASAPSQPLSAPLCAAGSFFLPGLPKCPAQHLAAVIRLHLISCWFSGPGHAGGSHESQCLACHSDSVALGAPLEEKPQANESWALWPERCVSAAGQSGARSQMGPPSLNVPATPPLRMGP